MININKEYQPPKKVSITKTRKKRNQKPKFRWHEKQTKFLFKSCINCNGVLVFEREGSWMELNCKNCSFRLNNSDPKKFQKFNYILKQSKNIK